MSFPNPGDTYVNRFAVRRLLGKGGFASVFLAFDNVTNAEVALKVLQPDEGGGYQPSTRARFLREVRLVARINHPNVVKLIAVSEETASVLWAAFEYVPGADLRKMLRQRGRLQPAEVELVLRQSLHGLAAAHRAGLLHRDIKPDNLLVFDGERGPLTLRIVDFGIARGDDRGTAVTKTGELIGTPRYMSPEQLRAVPLTPASDLYSLGLVAYELLYGEHALGSWCFLARS